MWQPIETIPKDGTDVLAYGDDEIIIASYRIDLVPIKRNPDGTILYKQVEGIKQETDCTYVWPSANLTHWMHLPNKPLTTKE